MFGVRQRKKPVISFMERLDAFPKIRQSVRMEYSASHVFLAFLVIVIWLIYCEFLYFSEIYYAYTFTVDTSFKEYGGAFDFFAVGFSVYSQLTLYVDLTVATKCEYLATSMDGVKQKSLASSEEISMVPVRFKLSPDAQLYWNMLRNVRELHVPERLHHLSERNSLGFEIWRHLHEFAVDRQNNASSTETAIVDACRIHGYFLMNKLRGFNFSHRIEKFGFGPRIAGIINPLDGFQKESFDRRDMFYYYIQVVPTKITDLNGMETFTSQYSVTHKRRIIDHDQGSHGSCGIFIYFDFAPMMVLIRKSKTSLFVFALRICAIVGGIFACTGNCMEEYNGDVINNFRQAVKSCLTLLSVPVKTRHIEADEIKTTAEVATHRLIEAARRSERHFVRLYALFSAYCPEEVLKEEINDMKQEIERKKNMLLKHEEKMIAWEQILSEAETPLTS
ncbi:Endoplasmic reticulum-Golgi intermediate compartment protein 2 [Trichinella patagoniensis]|uniref:Endoplasmic reticulum-Golgi intermediate compartment protein 2 n=1 Tax=Trichinella patagoniensis TaxID=990121 RepID=A0A0V1A5B7_9BILA|nr:Endoplasmic reticulum-Golgi intermediate compartment protein 2 [Trichinella patagoniensis]KRY19998.1 Endoplasmic reticulum-Golgi intermediate compartment protein 2 [Trichinella patagoniensis]